MKAPQVELLLAVSLLLKTSAWLGRSNVAIGRQRQGHLLLFQSTKRSNDDIERSYVSKISSKNVAGLVSGEAMVVNTGSPRLCIVTGETGSGKSLLVARALELLTGRRGTKASLLAGQEPASSNQSAATVEIELVLTGAYLEAASLFLKKELSMELLPDPTKSEESATVVLSRSLSLKELSQRKLRLQSVCHINGQQVTLKMLTAFARPLVTVVDASTAASALAKPEARLSVIDRGVSAELLDKTNQARLNYSRARRQRVRLERELASSSLPSSFSRESEADMAMLDHWIEELDAFQRRLQQFCDLTQVEDEQSTLYSLGHRVSSLSWFDTGLEDTEASETSMCPLYEALSDYRDRIRDLDQQLEAARGALDSLVALSSPESALTAVEKSRSFLFDSLGGSGGLQSDTLEAASERSHELLNEVESALAKCARYIEDDERGLLRTLENARQSCPLPMEDMEGILLDWNSLARKHGVLPTMLPSCHRILTNERDGNNNARAMLPKAIEEENTLLKELKRVSIQLSNERSIVANNLSEQVTARLPSLGMERFGFHSQLSARTDDSIAEDVVDFLLTNNESNASKGGKVNEVASNGEKARLLLAIECALPGSVGAASASSRSESGPGSPWTNQAPICVVYDEIDAHVGGRAAVAMGSMLVGQSQSSQVIAITHSPSVAAVADSHVVVQRESGIAATNTDVVKVVRVAGVERRKELARMASGDVAVSEAELLADALIRDGEQAKR